MSSEQGSGAQDLQSPPRATPVEEGWPEVKETEKEKAPVLGKRVAEEEPPEFSLPLHTKRSTASDVSSCSKTTGRDCSHAILRLDIST